MNLGKNIQAAILHFSTDHILNKPKPHALHIVDSAYLNVKLVKSPDFNDQDLSQKVTFTLSQLVLDSHTHPEAVITMEKQNVALEQIDDFLEFETSEIVQSWIIDDKTNHGIRIECQACYDYGLFFSNEEITMRIKMESIDNKKHFNRRSQVDNQNKNKDCNGSKKKPRCCRESMKVDLTKLPGFGFIEQPKYFDAYMCKGRCPLRYSALNAHTFLQSLMHLKSKKAPYEDQNNVPKPCCVATKFQPLDVLHVDEENPTKLKVTHWKNVIASSCGCV